MNGYIEKGKQTTAQSLKKQRVSLPAKNDAQVSVCDRGNFQLQVSFNGLPTSSEVRIGAFLEVSG